MPKNNGNGINSEDQKKDLEDLFADIEDTFDPEKISVKPKTEPKRRRKLIIEDEPVKPEKSGKKKEDKEKKEPTKGKEVLKKSNGDVVIEADNGEILTLQQEKEKKQPEISEDAPDLFGVDGPEVDIIAAEKEKRAGIKGVESKKLEEKLSILSDKMNGTGSGSNGDTTSTAPVEKKIEINTKKLENYNISKSKIEEMFKDDEDVLEDISKDEKSKDDFTLDVDSLQKITDDLQKKINELNVENSQIKETEAKEEQEKDELKNETEDKELNEKIVNDYEIENISSINDVEEEELEVKESEPEVKEQESEVKEQPQETKPEVKNNKYYKAYDMPEATQNHFSTELNDYSNRLGMDVSETRFIYFNNKVAEINNSDQPNSLKYDEFSERFKNHYKVELTHALKNNAQQRINGKSGYSVIETTNMVDQMMREHVKAMQDSNLIDKNVDFPSHGGLSPEEVKDIQKEYYNILPEDKRKAGEDKQIDKQYKSNVRERNEEVTKNFSNTVDKINEKNGVQFSSKGIETYLKTCWNDAGKKSKDIAEQRENFLKEYKDFCGKALAKMSDKANTKANPEDIANSLESLNKSMTDICKKNGWMDKDQKSIYMGGLLAKEIADIQKNSLSAKPKNLAEYTANKAEELSESKFKVGNVKYSKEIKDKIPLAKDGSLDNPTIREAVGMVKALDQQHAGRKWYWKMRHPILNSREKSVIKDIKNDLQNKGYKDVIDYFNKNPLKETDDFIKNDYDTYSKKIDELQMKNEQIEKKLNSTDSKTALQHEGKRITVPEADNTKEIVNPEVKSPKIVPQKEKTLDKSGPSMSNGDKK